MLATVSGVYITIMITDQTELVKQVPSTGRNTEVTRPIRFISGSRKSNANDVSRLLDCCAYYSYMVHRYYFVDSVLIDPLRTNEDRIIP